MQSKGAVSLGLVPGCRAPLVEAAGGEYAD